MADISHIKGPDNTSYNIKDATAREETSNIFDIMISEFDSSKSYGAGSYALFNGKIYQRKDDNNWVQTSSPATSIRWQEAVLGDIGKYAHESRRLIAQFWDSLTQFKKGDYCIYGTSISSPFYYRCLEDTSGSWDSSKWTRLLHLTDDLKLKVNSSGDTMTGELITSTGKVAMGSGVSTASTIEALVEDLRFTSGCSGSVYITSPYTLNGITIPAEWYHYFYAPHRSGGYNGGIHPDYEDNTLYGCIILSDLFGNSERSYIIHFIRQGASAYPTIKIVKKLMCDEPTDRLTQHGTGVDKTFTKLYEQLNSNGSIRAFVEQASNPDNFSRCVIGVRGYWSDDTLAANVYIGVSCNHSTNHTPGYILSHPKAFLDTSTSLGKVTSLAYAIKNTTYVNSAVTSYVRYVRSGHIVNVFYTFTTAGALTNRWCTLFSGLPKPVDSLYVNGEGDRLAVSTTGVMQNVYTTSAATFSRGTFTYITDDFN